MLTINYSKVRRNGGSQTHPFQVGEVKKFTVITYILIQDWPQGFYHVSEAGQWHLISSLKSSTVEPVPPPN